MEVYHDCITVVTLWAGTESSRAGPGRHLYPGYARPAATRHNIDVQLCCMESANSAVTLEFRDNFAT
jgi:hypothetical protein